SWRDAMFGDFDGDARVDLLVARQDSSVALYHNTGFRRFDAVTTANGLGAARSATVAVGDYDNDGFLDVHAGTTLWRGAADASFPLGPRTASALHPIAAVGAGTVHVVD